MSRLKISANKITALRILGTIVLVFLKVPSAVFYLIYTLTGITDVLDGYFARKTGTASEFGARLDSVSDIIFYTVMLLKLLPSLISALPKRIWLAVGLALILRIISYTVAAVKYRTFASLHTYLNKLTGLAVFAVPYLFYTDIGAAYSCAVAALAVISSGEELIIHIIGKKYDPSVKYVLSNKIHNA